MGLFLKTLRKRKHHEQVLDKMLQINSLLRTDPNELKKKHYISFLLHRCYSGSMQAISDI